MKKIILSIAIALYGYCAVAQDLPLAAGSDNPLTGTLYSSNTGMLFNGQGQSAEFKHIIFGNGTTNALWGIEGTSPIWGINNDVILGTQQNFNLRFLINNAIGTTLNSTGFSVTGTLQSKLASFYGAVGTATSPTLGATTNASIFLTNNTGLYGLVGGVDGVSGGTWMQAQRVDGAAVAYNMMLNPAGGNVGIGTTGPVISLEVAGDPTLYGGPAYQSTIQSRDTRAFAAGVGGGITFAGNYTALPNNTEFAGIAGIKENSTGGDYAGALIFSTRINGAIPTERLRITSWGSVLIGKTAQQPGANYKLDIGGSARADKIVVNTTGADFVFDKKYTLPKLSYVKTYIAANHHLPEIPSAKEMQTNGMNVGEINTKLLQKVEELTLYLIQQKEAFDKQNKAQQEQIDELKQQLTQITKALTKN